VDFPKSLPSVGLVDGKFVDENAQTGTPGSLIPSAWGNSITLEVLNVISAAGLAPSEADLTQLLKAIRYISQGGAGSFGVDTGSTNVYTVGYTPAIAALVDGQVLRFRAKTGNTAGCTFSPSGLVAKTLVGLGLSALQGGEIVAGGLCAVVYAAALDQWVLLSSSGGALPIAPAVKSQQAVQLGQVGHGQCRLGTISATSIKLVPCNGNNLIINGVPRQIPSSGVTLTNGGMNPSTLYYIYGYWTGYAIALEFSVIGHSTNVDGVEIKAGDATRTLVGMVYSDSSAQFADGPISRMVASWFNRRAVSAGITTSGILTFTATTNTEISSGVRLNFLTWANEAVDIKLTGQYTNGAAAQSVSVQSYVDGIAYGNLCGSYISAAGVGMAYASSSSLKSDGSYLSEGFHMAQVFGNVTANTGSSLQMSHSLVTRI
jgi:hypothetical protein